MESNSQSLFIKYTVVDWVCLKHNSWPTCPHTPRIQGTHLENQQSSSTSLPEHTLQTKCPMAKNIKEKETRTYMYPLRAEH